MTDIETHCRRYLKQGLLLTTTLFLVGLVVQAVWYVDLLIPLVVSLGFSIVIEVLDVEIWKRVATKHPDSLPTFFMGVSGGRMLLALAVMFVIYMLTSHEVMVRFFLTFMVFYVGLLIHHIMFFTKVLRTTSSNNINGAK